MSAIRTLTHFALAHLDGKPLEERAKIVDALLEIAPPETECAQMLGKLSEHYVRALQEEGEAQLLLNLKSS